MHADFRDAFKLQWDKLLQLYPDLSRIEVPLLSAAWVMVAQGGTL